MLGVHRLRAERGDEKRSCDEGSYGASVEHPGLPPRVPLPEEVR